MELVNITYLGTADNQQTYSQADRSLISTNIINTEFGRPDDYIELFIYDLNNEIIFRDYTTVEYEIGENINPINGLTSIITLDPERDIKKAGIDRGNVVSQYNFYRRQLDSRAGRRMWIKEISTSRTEIKAATQEMSNDDLAAAFGAFSAALAQSNNYPDFYLNFGENRVLLGVNAIYVEEDGVGYILFKLYEPLPAEFDLKSQFWVVQKIAEPARYQIDIQIEAEIVQEQFNLRGPNYNIELADSIGQTTPYYNYDTLFTTPVAASLQQIKSYLDDQAVAINVDYSKFSNFIHFSSATERVLNFVYKLKLIEDYQASIQSQATLPPGTITSQIVNTSTNTLQQSIDNIIKKFDPYEYYLYFSSASTAWPKSNSVEPYTLYSVTSSQAIDWLGSADILPTATSLSILYSASLYDNTNSDGLRYTAPTYIREDEANEPYLVFLDMIGQHFDNIWLYYKDLSNRYSADNNPNTGISLDVVTEALKGFGIQLYTNTNLSNNIYYSLLGIGNEGSTLPLTSSLYAQIDLASSSLYPLAGEPWLSSSVYLPPFENEKLSKYVTTFKTPQTNVTASFDQLSPTQVEQEIYKRIYHNLPYLLKTKGTERGVRALIACYGIPNSILTINEYGGADKFIQADLQGIQDNKIYTASRVELNDKQLTPFTTIQEYTNNFSVNSPNIEIAFTPADSINADITSSIPNLSIQQLIGNPALQYSSSYGPLVEVADAYFKANYTKGYNVWDFIRVIKFYNNSLFKMLKDFVPARASLMSGIVIKPHMLERNKYERHEPVMTTSSLEDDIKMLAISASDPAQIKYSTAYTDYIQTANGLATIDNIFSAEKYTGEFGGSTITITDGQAFDQSDYPESLIPQRIRINPYVWFTDGTVYATFNNAKAAASAVTAKAYTEAEIPPIGARIYVDQSLTTPYGTALTTTYLGVNDGIGNEYVIEINSVLNIANITQTVYSPYARRSVNYGALFQNVTSSVKSTRFLDLDYSTNVVTPVNYGLITQSIDAGPAALSDQYAPFAQLQDYNYSLRRSILPRYEGSKTRSKFYNKYSPLVSTTTTEKILQLQNSVFPGGTVVPWSTLGSATNPYFIDSELIGAASIVAFILNGTSYTVTGFDPETGRINLQPPVPVIGDILIRYNETTQEAYEGDSSYGLSAAIDRNSIKLGWVKSFESQSRNFYEKTSITLKYLVDADANLVELNRDNRNLFDVQNIFKSGDNLVVSLTDINKPSFQKPLDGLKKIFRGGFSYDPLIYREGGVGVDLINRSGDGIQIRGAGWKGFGSNWFYASTTPNAIIGNSATNWMTANPSILNTGANGYVWSINDEGLGLPGSLEQVPFAIKVPFLAWEERALPNGALFKDTEWLGLTKRGPYSGPREFTEADAGAYAINITKFLDLTTPDAFFRETFESGSVLGKNEDNWMYKVSKTAEYEVSCEFTVALQTRHWTELATEQRAYGPNATLAGISVGLFDCTRNQATFDRYTCSEFGWGLVRLSTAIWVAAQGCPFLAAAVLSEDLPVESNFAHPYLCRGETHKLVAVLEKTKTPDDAASWTYVASTKFNPTVKAKQSYATDSSKNMIHLPTNTDGFAKGLFELKLIKDTITNVTQASWDNAEPLKINLETDDYIRMMLYFVDTTLFAKYGGQFSIEIARKPGSVSKFLPQGAYSTIAKPYFKIIDPSQTTTVYNTTTTIGDGADSVIFSKYNNEGSTLIFSKSASANFIENVFFAPDPTSIITNLYTPVIDDLNLKPYDLLRIGTITQPNPQYYEITNVYRDTQPFYEVTRSLSPSQPPFVLFNDPYPEVTSYVRPIRQRPFADGSVRDCLLLGQVSTVQLPIIRMAFGQLIFLSPLIPGQATIRLKTNNPTSAALLGSLNNTPLTITGVWESSLTGPVQNNQATTNLAYLNIYVPIGEDGITLPGNFSLSQIPLVTIEQIKLNLGDVRLFVDIQPNCTLEASNISDTFGILRPKPDETSVIIEHTKKLGEVPQAILIPGNASNEIQEQAASIFTKVNPDLANQIT